MSKLHGKEKNNPKKLSIHKIKKYIGLNIVMGIFLTSSHSIFAKQVQVSEKELRFPTRVVTLGTGTPNIISGRAGMATAIIVNREEVYLFDAGSGFMQTLGQFTHGSKKNIFPESPSYPEYMYPTFLNKLFLTHLDSDHILGLPELLLRGWVLERNEPVKIWGPKGTKHLVDGIVEAYKPDIDHRLGSLPLNGETPYQGIVSEFGTNPDMIYKDKYVTISAFNVEHGSWKSGTAVGYRIEAPDKTIVISGDTRYSENLIKHAQGADILLHEVMSQTGLDNLPSNWQDYMKSAHTTTKRLASVAEQVEPRLLVMIHALFLGATEETLNNEMKTSYQGNFKLADDGDIFQ